MKINLYILFSILYCTVNAQQSSNLEKGIEFFNTGEDEKAIACFEKEIKANPKSSEAWYYIGLTKNTTNTAAGMDEFTKAIELNPNYAEAYNNRAGIYGYLGDTEKELSDYNNAVRSDPTNGAWYYNRAVSYLSLERYKEAIEDCNKSIELEFHGAPFAYDIRAKAKIKIGDFAGALADCDYMIAISDGGNPDAYTTRGDLKLEMKKYEDAIADFLQASILGGDGPFNLYKIGMVRLEMNDQKGACEMFLRAKQEGFEIDQELLDKCK
ncbi:MAG: tetratricopeptide repeat protein [Fluviicola sp.]|nr:tetratricopeptide repeat protein [Fluviicola sp.]